MGDATGRLGEGNADGAVDSQGRALEALRKGAQSLAEAMQQGDGDQPGDGPGNPRGRQQGAANSTDPLGRPMRHNEFSDDYYGEDPRRDRRAAGAPDPRRTAPPSRRSVPPADRARLHRAAAEGLLSGSCAVIVVTGGQRRVSAVPTMHRRVVGERWWARLRSAASYDYPLAFLAASASATAVRMSCTENGFVTTSCTMALRPEARSR